MRSTLLRALLVCSVPKTSRPVSAAVNASEIVSKSRISPTSTTSASSRNAARTASGNERVLAGTSRWVMMLSFVVMNKLDRLFDRDDVSGEVDVDVVN